MLAAPGAAFADASVAAKQAGSALTTAARVPGDVDLDGVPDFLAPAADGSLTLFRGGSAGGAGPETASTASRSPRGDDWNNYLLAHRGAVMGGGDSLFAYHKGYKQLYLYANDADAYPDPVPGHFTRTYSLVGSSGTLCDRGVDGTWDHIAQLTAVQRGTGGTNLVTVENGHLRYYPFSYLAGCYFGAGVELGAEGADWSGFTLLSPGEVDGVPTLWVRDTATGAVTALPLPLDAVGKPVSGFTRLTLPAGRPLVSAIKDTDGKDLCADIDHAWTSNGTASLLWNCADQGAAPNQRFTLGTDGSLHVLGKCLDVTGGATAAGSPVNLWDCNNSPAQQWVTGPYPGTLKNPNSGKCLDAPGAATAGTRLAIGECDSGAGRQWTVPAAHAVLPIGLAAGAFPAVDSPGDTDADGRPDLVVTAADGRVLLYPSTAPAGGQPRFGQPRLISGPPVGQSIRSVHNPSRCLDNYGAPDNGPLRLYGCWGSASQRFAFALDGTLRTGERCVAVQGDRTEPGTPAVIVDCQGTGGQIWKYRADGSLYNPASDSCLDLPGWNDANGTALTIWSCNGGTNQRWTLTPNPA
ncbi:ricin-type beta-trefoil lectin domain protein [Kitasatospora sp. NBC_00458]|uniref:ricin-type beta-trefoil lectin domain protein n=1 Tax=Kitasatospora sp. NBC_00458 TaxID=2903568 RepID=UPI002E1916D0